VIHRIRNVACFVATANPLQGGIGCVGVSRVLAGDSSGGDAAAAPAATGWMPLGQVLQGSSWAGHGGEGGGHLNGGGAPSGDSKMALLGMGLILLSQVSALVLGLPVGNSLSAGKHRVALH